MELKNGLIIFFLMLFGTVGNAQEWKVFNCFEGNFSILSPETFEERNSQVVTNIGTVKLNTLYIVNQDSSDNFLYLINYYDLPEEALPKDSTELITSFLLESMDQNITDIDGEVLYSNPIKIGTHPGLMWRGKYVKGAVKAKAFVVDNRFIMLQVYSRKGKEINKDVDKFLDSFTLSTS